MAVDLFLREVGGKGVERERDKMTVYETYLSMVEEAKHVHQQELETLKDNLKKEQGKYKHKWGARIEEMFYALGETAPGKQCTKCGLQKHVKRGEYG